MGLNRSDSRSRRFDCERLPRRAHVAAGCRHRSPAAAPGEECTAENDGRGRTGNLEVNVE
jgi:hypothetical protein